MPALDIPNTMEAAKAKIQEVSVISNVKVKPIEKADSLDKGILKKHIFMT